MINPQQPTNGVLHACFNAHWKHHSIIKIKIEISKLEQHILQEKKKSKNFPTLKTAPTPTLPETFEIRLLRPN